MDTNKYGVESLKTLLNSVTEVLSDAQVQMLERIAALEEKVIILENKIKELEDKSFDKSNLANFTIEPERENVVVEPFAKNEVVEVFEKKDEELEPFEEKEDEVFDEKDGELEPFEERADDVFEEKDGELEPFEEKEDEVFAEKAEELEPFEEKEDEVFAEKAEEMEPFEEKEDEVFDENALGKDDFELNIEPDKIILEKAKPDWYDWEIDYPGTHIDDLWEGIGFNDRLLFAKELFYNSEEDFKHTMQMLNNMKTFREAVEYIRNNYPSWDEESDEVYRFYMNVRRKLK